MLKNSQRLLPWSSTKLRQELQASFMYCHFQCAVLEKVADNNTEHLLVHRTGFLQQRLVTLTVIHTLFNLPKTQTKGLSQAVEQNESI